jgi:hypothetical protein
VILIAEHRVRDEPPIVFLARVVQTGLNDCAAQRIEFGNKERLKLAREELTPLPRAFLIHIRSALDLLIHPQEHARNDGASTLSWHGMHTWQ